jgi:hypothetical protein
MKIETLIITLEQALLVENSGVLSGYGSEFSIDIVTGITPQQLPQNVLKNEFSSLSMIEIAIAKSHEKARQIARAKNLDWVVILEDDAVPLADNGSLEAFLKQIETTFGNSDPIAVHLAPEQFGLLWKRRRDCFFRIALVPDCAVAYALNHEALEFLSNKPTNLNEVADWPHSMKKLRWIAPLKPYFKHPQIEIEDSSTMDSRKQRRENRPVLKKIFATSMVKAVFILGLRLFTKPYGTGFVEDKRFRTRILQIF